MHDRYGAFADIDPDARGGHGPLAGLNIGIKSNIAVKGLPWTAGMGTRRAVVAERDAACVVRLRTAGAKVVGTLGMHEAALGATSDNVFFGRIHNAHRHGFTPGGSSGGSGTAVAAGLVDAALGTDTLGSVRIPAAYNGIYGLKPTNGTVDDEGLVHLGRRFDCIGPLARELDVLERVWDAISAPVAAQRQGRPHGEKGWRVVTLAALDSVDIEPAVRIGYERAVSALGDSSYTLSLPHSLTAVRLAALVECVEELKAMLGEARYGAGVSDELKSVIGAIEKITPAPHILEDTRTRLVDALGDDGLLVTPTTPQVAFAFGPRPPTSQSQFTGLANVAGLPALSVPVGLDDAGLPIGVQLVGPRHSDTQLIALARRLEPVFGGSKPPAMED